MRRLLLPLIPLVALCAPPAVVKDSARTGLDAARLANIPVRMQEFVDKGTMAGSVTLVARHGVVAALDAAGYTDIETRQPMKTDAIFQLHSMTKPVVGIAAMMLAEEGKLAIGDPVSKYIPEFRSMWVLASQDGDRTRTLRRPARAVTLRDLMTHTSGMSTNPPPAIGELHRELNKTLADAVLVISQQPLDFDPGTKWQYSNTGIATLGRVIEIVSGMPFEKFLETRIFKPLGMRDTFIFPPRESYSRMPTTYIQQNGKPVKYTADPLGEGVLKYRQGAKYPLPEGGLYSTASDLFALYQMMLNGGQYNGVRILSRRSVEVMTQVHTGDLQAGGPGMGYGLTWAVVRDATGTLPLSSIGAYGHGGRYGTYCFIDPKKDLLGIFLIQREGGSDERTAFVEMTMASLLD